MPRSSNGREPELPNRDHRPPGNGAPLTPQDGCSVESATMNSMPFWGFVPFLFAVPALAWYIAVIVLLYRILQELKRIRA
jgi:hypothetical protein